MEKIFAHSLRVLKDILAQVTGETRQKCPTPLTLKNKMVHP